MKMLAFAFCNVSMASILPQLIASTKADCTSKEVSKRQTGKQAFDALLFVVVSSF